MSLSNQEKARLYSVTKYSLSLLDTFYVLILLFIFVATGFSKVLAAAISQITASHLFILALYLLFIILGYFLFDLPLNFSRTYLIEHKFCLSRQAFGDWLLDQLKASLIFYIIGLVMLGAFYFILGLCPNNWWLIVSLFWIFFSLILAKLTPTIIIPMFFKYKKLGDEVLRQRILALAKNMKVRILDVFEIDFSKKTLKANAAFVGIGGSRRVILADTLKDKYTHDEIEVILAHEFAHYRLRHILKLIAVNSAATLLILYIIFRTAGYFLGMFGLSGLADIAALPLILIYFVLFGIITQPFENYISRILEKNADRSALEVTGLKDAFISMMDKLAEQNLADRKPHPLIKFFFFDHPPIDERIDLANKT